MSELKVGLWAYPSIIAVGLVFIFVGISIVVLSAKKTQKKSNTKTPKAQPGYNAKKKLSEENNKNEVVGDEIIEKLEPKAIGNKIINKSKSKDGLDKILILDDDESIRRTLQEYFVNNGYQTYSAKTNDDALNYISNENIDVVITDIAHPGENGLELIRNIKRFYYNTDAIVLSGTVPEINTPEECLDAGASAVFKKPAKLVDILDAVKDLFEKKDMEIA